MASSSPDRYRWLYAAVGAASLALSLPWLASISAWRDEAATRSASTRSASQLWQLLHNTDAVLGAYYFALHAWIAVFGDSWFAMRLPSSLALAGAAVIATACGRIAGGMPVASVTAVLMLLLPGVVWSGLDARPTALAMLLVTTALWFWLRWSTVPTWPVFALLTVAGAIQLTCSLQLSALLNRRSLRSRRFWLYGVLVLLVLSPLVVIGRHQVGQVAWIHTPWNTQLSSALLGRVSDSPQSALTLVSTSTVTNLLLALLVAGIAVVVLLTVRTQIVRRLAAWAYLPPLLAIAVGVLTGSSQYVARYFASSVPAIAILVAIGICQLSRTRPRQIAITVLLAGLCVPGMISQRMPDGKRGEDLLATARAIHATNSDVPIFYVDNAVTVALAYPTDVRGHRQVPDPSLVPASGTLWGSFLDNQAVSAQLPAGDSLVILPTVERTAFAPSAPCTITHTTPGKPFSVLHVSCRLP